MGRCRTAAHPRRHGGPRGVVAVSDVRHEGARPEEPATSADALAWLSAEHRVLLAVLARSTDAGLDSQIWQLAKSLDEFLYRAGHWHDQIAAWEAALSAARRLGDAAAQGAAHRGLCRAKTRLGLDHEAHIHLRDALTLDTQADYKEGQAQTHYFLAYLEERQGDRAKGLRHVEQALSLYQETGNRAGEAEALNAIGWHHALLGDYDRTLHHCGRALPLLRQLGRRMGEAGTLHSLGYAHHHLGDSARAVECYQQALALLRDLGERFHEGEVLIHLGDAHCAAGDTSAAREAWQRAMDIFNELGHPDVVKAETKLAEL